MDTVTYGITYLLLYRFAIILLGAFSIYLGYRLFTQVLPSKKTLDNNAELKGKIGTIEFSLKKAAPGTFFAAFGAIIIIMVLADNPPEFSKVTHAATAIEPNNTGHTTKILVRDGCDSDKLPETSQEYHDAIWKHYDKMLGLAKNLVEISPGEGQYQDTLAGLYFIDNDFTNALKTQEKAVQYLPQNENLQRRLKAYRTAASE